MDNRGFQQNEYNEPKKKGGRFWRNFGLFVLALGLSALTVLIINLNR